MTGAAPGSLPNRRVLGAMAVLSVACFLLALAFPAIGTCAHGPPGAVNWFDNGTVVAFGWLAPLMGEFGWYANIPGLIGVVLLARGRRPWPALPIAEAMLTASAFLPVELWHNEAWSEPVCRHGAGMWLWTLAHGLVVAGALVARPRVTP